MDWKTDSNLDESETEPYSSFQSSKSGRWIDRMELPIILIGAGLLALVILFVVFIPKKNEFTIDDYKHLVSRIDQLEKKVEDLGGKEMDVREFDPAQNPVQYQQLINWIKSNAEVISETMKKVDDIESQLKTGQKSHLSGNVPPRAETPVPTKQTATSAVKSPEKPKPIAEKKAPSKSQPVQVTPTPAPRPEVAAAPLVPEEKTAVIEQKPAVAIPQPKITDAPAASKPETVKLIFHRVEKGETLYRIARNYGISVEKLQELNDMKKDELLIHVGQELIVKKEKH